MLFSIIACVLATIAVVAVVVEWRISWLNVRWMRDSVKTCSARLKVCESSLSATSNQSLALAVDDLRADLDEARADWAKQRSKLWGRLSVLERDERDAREYSDEEQHPLPLTDRDALRATHLPRSIGTVPQPKVNGNGE